MQRKRPDSRQTDALRERFAAHGQGHVFRFWDRLDEPARARLAAQAGRIDLEELARIDRATREAAPAPGGLSPAPIERLPEHGGDPTAFAEARERGEELLAAGRVAVLVVAGGQGTRLGFDGPKGAFPIGPVGDRTLFAVHAQKIRRARRRYGAPLPWYVMTSPATDAATRTLFDRQDCFGLPHEDVFFLQQGTVPALDFDGRLILEAPDRIAESPNGHGGCFAAAAQSGALDDMARRGATTVFYFQVDNPLVRVASPLLLGFHAAAGAQMSCTVVRKRDPEEKMGVVAVVKERVGIVEYTELDDQHRYAKDARGELVYWAGSVAIHGLEVDFMRWVAEQADRLLPYHASVKKIPCLTEQGQPVRPERPNGRKLERFLFDALPAAERVAVLEAAREAEYSPVKNSEGPDSPATVRRDLEALYRSWLEGAGVEVPTDVHVEIDHALIDDAEDVRQSGIRSLAEAHPALRIAPGGA